MNAKKNAQAELLVGPVSCIHMHTYPFAHSVFAIEVEESNECLKTEKEGLLFILYILLLKNTQIKCQWGERAILLCHSRSCT